MPDGKDTVADPTRTEPLPLEFPGVHHIDERETEAAMRVLRSRSYFRYYGLDLQNEVTLFEKEFAEVYGVPHAIAVTSGTGALSVALSALGVGPGQEVIVPAYLWVSVAGVVVNQGAIPVLADIDDTFCMNAATVERAITSRTSGVIFVHMSGAPGNVAPVAELVSRRGLFLLEDCAQCNGGSIHGRKVGTFGDMAAFSFQMNKNMTSGEGGGLITRNTRLFQRADACHDLGYSRENGRLVFNNLDLCLWGKGMRLDEIRASVLRVQLQKLPAITGAMRHSKYRIRHSLEGIQGVQLRTIQDPDGDTGCFLITTYADPATAQRVNRMLRAEGIVTFPQGITDIVMTDWGLHVYSNIVSLVRKTGVDSCGSPWTMAENRESQYSYEKGACPVADSLFERSILIAIPSCLTAQDEDDIILAFEKTLRACL